MQYNFNTNSISTDRQRCCQPRINANATHTAINQKTLTRLIPRIILLMLILISSLLNNSANASVIKWISGDHTWYIIVTHHSNYEEALAACSAYQASWGAGPCVTPEDFNVNPGPVVTGPSPFVLTFFDPWRQEHYQQYSYYTPVVCTPPLVLSQEYGCILKDDNCPTIDGTNPISIGLGSKYQTETDFVGNGSFPLTVKRTYNSAGQGPKKPGPSWQFFSQLDWNIDFLSALITRPNGKQILFNTDGDGGWLSDPDVTGTLESIIDGAGAITGWVYSELNSLVEEFDEFGKLVKATHLTGASHSYVYEGTAITVTHSNGEVLTYQLPGESIITGFTSPENQQFTYTSSAVNGRWHIDSVTYPDGGIRTYHYENTIFPSALTGITDENGDRFSTWAFDSEGRAISSEHHGGADKVTIDYTNIDDPGDSRAVTTNALGKQTTYHFTTVHGVRKVNQVEGHPTASCAGANKNYAYDTNGFTASKTDWKGNTTTYVRNAKGQELSRTEAFGTPDARTITTEWHPTFNLRNKVTEPDRETTYTYDTNGNLLSQQTTDLLTP